MRSVFIILFLSTLFGQSKYPADSILISKNVSIIHKVGILPIAAWQRISYNSDFFNCQFYPSCSNYGASAMKQFGLIRGGAMSSERIMRCSPFAFHYQLKYQRPFRQKDGRLEDPLIPTQNAKPNKSPFFAGLLSAILPGSGRIYAGRFFDGIMGMSTMYFVGYSANHAVQNENSVRASIYVPIAFFMYLGEIYGGWRAAKYDQIPKQKSFKPII